MTTICSYDHDLEDHIELLRKLDDARQYSADLRDQGIDVLLESIHKPEEHDITPDFGDWRHETSLVVRALLTRHNQPFTDNEDKEKTRCEFIKAMTEHLKKGLTLDKIKESELSVLVAASSLRAMAASPGAIFTKEAMYCYYWIIRELYTADRSDWNIGGARAAPESSGRVTAFVTGECVRALLMVATTMENAGKFVSEIFKYLERIQRLDLIKDKFFSEFDDEYHLQHWIDLEKNRAALSCKLKLQKYSRFIAISNDITEFINNSDEISLNSIIQKFRDFISSAASMLTNTLIDIRNFRKEEKKLSLDSSINEAESVDVLLDKYLTNNNKKIADLDSFTREKLNTTTRSESAHFIAMLAIKNSLARVIKARNFFQEKEKEKEKEVDQLQLIFDEAAIEIHKLLRPIQNYLSSIIDRELTFISQGQSGDWQPSELACAASCYGRMTKKWKKDLRFNQAVNTLSEMITSHGHFANPTFYHERSDGVTHVVANSATLHSMAQLLRFARESEIGAELTEKILRFFEDTRGTKPRQTWRFHPEEIKFDFIKELCVENNRKKPYLVIKNYFENSISKIKFPSNSDQFSESAKKAMTIEMAKELNNLLQSEDGRIFGQLSDAQENSKNPYLRRQFLERIFSGHIVVGTSETVCDKKGWAWEFSVPPLKTGLTATASAVLALAEINEMLDARINHIILEHFSVKDKDKKLNETTMLDDLFYPDYGLSIESELSDDLIKKLKEDEPIKFKPTDEEATDGNKKKGRMKKSYDLIKNISKQGIIRKEKELTAFTLQRMSAHVLRLELPKQYKSLFSVVFHGPAGTGKTFFVESLAASCEVPLVEITPSDLVKRGQDNIEERARTVFEALSMLTRAIILFDEFDPVLKRRGTGDENQLNVFSFLTPGMLPKLKDLHNGAEKRSVAYVLITNLIGDLDEAAIRQGRFDMKLGIYPPDWVSRTGRFLDVLLKYDNFLKEKQQPEFSYCTSRIKDVIKETGGKGMTDLSKKWWFRFSTEEAKQGSPFYYVWKNGDLDKLEPDDELTGIIGEGRNAEKEFLQWFYIDCKDKDL